MEDVTDLDAVARGRIEREIFSTKMRITELNAEQQYLSYKLKGLKMSLDGNTMIKVPEVIEVGG